MLKPLLTAIANALAATGLSPVLLVMIVFATAYLVIGVPLHLTRGPSHRDSWGTFAGVLAGLLYLTVLFYTGVGVQGSHPTGAGSAQKVLH